MEYAVSVLVITIRVRVGWFWGHKIGNSILVGGWSLSSLSKHTNFWLFSQNVFSWPLSVSPSGKTPFFADFAKTVYTALTSWNDFSGNFFWFVLVYEFCRFGDKTRFFELLRVVSAIICRKRATCRNKSEFIEIIFLWGQLCPDLSTRLPAWAVRSNLAAIMTFSVFHEFQIFIRKVPHFYQKSSKK